MTTPPPKMVLALVCRGIPDGEDAATTVACLRAFGAAVGAAPALAVTNELVQSLRMNAGLPPLAAAFRAGELRVAYTPAHDADPTLLSPEELVDEVRLNERCLHEILGAPAPERRVLVLGSLVDEQAVLALEAHGIDALVVRLNGAERVRLGERLLLMPSALPSELERLGASGLARLAGELHRSGARVAAPDDILVGDAVTPHWLPRVAPSLPPLGERAGAGRAVLLGWLLDALGFERAPCLPPTALFDQHYRLERLPPRVRAPLLSRLARREGAQVAAHALLDLFSVELELGARPAPSGELPAFALDQLDDLEVYEALRRNGWRGRDRWLKLVTGLRARHAPCDELLTASSSTSG
jgi:hypothetical protein